MTASKPVSREDEWERLAALNDAWASGVLLGLCGPKDARPLIVGKSGAVRDQFYRGLLWGRELRGTCGEA